MVPAQAELLLRTEHPVGVLASNLDSLELESPGKRHACRRKRVVPSLLDDRGTTDHLDHLLAVVDFAQRQTIRVGMGTHRLHLADDHILEPGGHGGDLLDGRPQKGEAFRQLLGAVAQTGRDRFEPRVGDVHVALLSVNCEGN